MKNIDTNKVLDKIKRRGIASLFATFVGCASLFVPMTVVACKQPNKTENNQPTPQKPEEQKPPEGEKEVTIELKDGIAVWNDFLEKAGKDFATVITNANDIKGFSGLAEYENLKKFLEDEKFKSKNFNTSDLHVHFDFVNDPTFEITPSIINGILKRISHLHIDGVQNGELKISSGIVDSNGNVASKEIFDIDRFNNYIDKKRLTKTNIGEISKNENSIILVGVENEKLRATKITDEKTIKSLLDKEFFKSDEAVLDSLILKGNLKDLYNWTKKEAKEGNIRFTEDSYYKQIDANRPDTIDINFIKDICKRGAKPNLYNVNIENKEDFVADGTISFSKTTLQNVSFPPDVNLSLIPFEHVKSMGTLKLEGTLPHKMKYLNADKVIIDRAFVPGESKDSNGHTIPKGTDITGAKIKDLYIKHISNIKELQVNKDAPKGEVLKFKGTKEDYDVLKNLLNIRTDNLDLEIVVALLKNYQNCLG